MRLFRFRISVLALSLALGCYLTLAATEQPLFAQETTGGLQGTVKDVSGAVVPGARVTITSASLIGSKELITDSSGYYHFANLPAGTYTVTVSANGFDTTKHEGLVIAVGHLPTVDIEVKVGAEATTVEVTSEAPTIDTTTTQNMTNISSQTLQNAPTGSSFQSVIQYAPMARNEPLSGMSVNGQATQGGGGSMPGSSGNGLAYGFSIGGAADSESSYLVEGQDTENVSGGYSSANVPMDFIQEVQMTTSGVQAEYGGALGGVANVILKKGSNDFHGEIFSNYESSGTDANPVNAFLRYDPTGAGASVGSVSPIDPNAQTYSSQKEHFRNVQPGVVVGGPILRNRLWFISAFNPWYSGTGRNINYGSAAAVLAGSPYTTEGDQYFTQDTQTYYGIARLDAAISQRIRVYGSWLYQFQRETGQHFPTADPIPQDGAEVLNEAALLAPQLYSHGIGSSSPNSLYMVGADVTLTQRLISTTKYGYFFTNYHDFGWPTSSPDLVWNTSNTSGSGACDNTPVTGNPGCATGAPLPANLQQDAGTQTNAYNSSYTLFNASKHYQFNQDFALYHGGWWGSHNFKFGYQLNHLTNVIDQNGNVPEVFINAGRGVSHSPFTSNGVTNCGAPPATVGGTGSGLEGEYYSANKTPPPPYVGYCAGQYGDVTIQDFATILENSSGKLTPAGDWNHALYAQDAWTIGKGLTLDLGLRIEHETLPAPGGIKVSSINFPWSDKIEPRLGAAWDPTGRGKMKIFGSYGVVNDVMKLLLAQTSWGAQAFEQCTYPLGPDGTAATTGGYANSDLDVVFKNGRACPTGAPTLGANFDNSSNTPPASLVDGGTGISLIENADERPWEPVAPNVKPYRQHEYVVGWDYQISQHWAFEARYDRRRLDHVIEDSSLSDTTWGEIYAIVNPGQGVDQTLDGYAAFLGSLGQAFGIQGAGYEFNAAAFGTCPSCPPQPKAIRNYDGVELRATLSPTRNWTGMFSYTYSSLWGNYPGLTTTDQTDGGTTGRNSPDTTRAFDEPFYYFGANGKSTAGPMPTDRPNVFKGLATYTLPWWRHQATTVGLFQYFYQGSPMSSFIDLLGSIPGEPYEATYIYGRGQWANEAVNPTTGAITLGSPYARRTPWYIQSDMSAKHDIKVGDHEDISFEATALNALNQHAVTSYWQGLNSLYYATPLYPGPATLGSGAALYQELESGYNPQTFINGGGGAAAPVAGMSEYGKPYLHQIGRSLRFGLRYTF